MRCFVSPAVHYVLLKGLHGDKRSLAIATVEHIGDESLFEIGFELAHDKMMDDPIAEIAGEYLAWLRFYHDEAYASSRLVRMSVYFAQEVKDIRFSLLKQVSEIVRGRFFVADTVIIRSKHVETRKRFGHFL